MTYATHQDARCAGCARTCCSCAQRAPEFDTSYGAMCGPCVANGQAGAEHEVEGPTVVEHACSPYDYSQGHAVCRTCGRTDYLHELTCPVVGQEEGAP